MEQYDPAESDSENLGLRPDELLQFSRGAGFARDVDQEALLNFALAIAESCAEIGDHYTANGKNCGDAIRAKFGLG